MTLNKHKKPLLYATISAVAAMTLVMSAPNAAMAYLPSLSSFDIVYTTDIGVNKTGHTYVTDFDNNNIKVYNSTGTLLFDFGSPGSGDGQFNSPFGLALDSQGNVYVADRGNSRVQIFDGAGNYVSKVGASGDHSLSAPMDVAVDSAQNIYVADGRLGVVRVFDSTGDFVRDIGSAGLDAGQFRGASDVIVDKATGNIYVADGNLRVQVFDETGKFLKVFADLRSERLCTFSIYGIAIDSAQNVYVVCDVASKIMVFDKTGNYVYNIAVPSAPSADGLLNSIDLDSAENIYVSYVSSDANKLYILSPTANPQDTSVLENKIKTLEGKLAALQLQYDSLVDSIKKFVKDVATFTS